MRLARYAFGVALLLLVIGWWVNNRGANDVPHLEQLLRDQPFEVDGTERSYNLFLPTDPSDAPVVVLLHGNGGGSDQLLGVTGAAAPYKRWLDIAWRENLILVVPQGLADAKDNRGWNDCRSDDWTEPDADDVAFLGSLVEEVRATYQIGDSAVFAAGTSNGGLMVQRLADEMPETFDAIAVVNGLRPVNSECPDSDVSIPIMFMNGTEDSIVPYGGGEVNGDRGLVASMADTLDYWIRRNGAEMSATQTSLPDTFLDDASSVTVFRHEATAGGAPVVLYEMVGAGHAAPSGVERYGRVLKAIVGEQNGDIEMADEIWAFFAETLPTARARR